MTQFSFQPIITDIERNSFRLKHSSVSGELKFWSNWIELGFEMVHALRKHSTILSLHFRTPYLAYVVEIVVSDMRRIRRMMETWTIVDVTTHNTEFVFVYLDLIFVDYQLNWIAQLESFYFPGGIQSFCYSFYEPQFTYLNCTMNFFHHNTFYTLALLCSLFFNYSFHNNLMLVIYCIHTKLRNWTFLFIAYFFTNFRHSEYSEAFSFFHCFAPALTVALIDRLVEILHKR